MRVTPRFWDLAGNPTLGVNALAPGNVLVTTDENTANGSTPDIQRIHDLQGRVVREVRTEGSATGTELVVLSLRDKDKSG